MSHGESGLKILVGLNIKVMSIEASSTPKLLGNFPYSKVDLNLAQWAVR
jgi:hypothetical protein